MPRLILFMLCWLILMNGTAEGAVRQEGVRKSLAADKPRRDTLAIEHDLAHQPFLLDTISLAALQRLLGEGSVVKKQPVRNRFIKNQVDTLITIRKGQSYIRLYAVSKAQQNFYQAAEIQDPLPIFQHSLYIGQSKKEIQGLFPELKRYASLPDLVQFRAGEGADFLYLIFDKGILRKVEFKPYLD